MGKGIEPMLYLALLNRKKNADALWKEDFEKLYSRINVEVKIKTMARQGLLKKEIVSREGKRDIFVYYSDLDVYEEFMQDFLKLSGAEQPVPEQAAAEAKKLVMKISPQLNQAALLPEVKELGVMSVIAICNYLAYTAFCERLRIPDIIMETGEFKKWIRRHDQWSYGKKETVIRFIEPWKPYFPSVRAFISQLKSFPVPDLRQSNKNVVKTFQKLFSRPDIFMATIGSPLVIILMDLRRLRAINAFLISKPEGGEKT